LIEVYGGNKSNKIEKNRKEIYILFFIVELKGILIYNQPMDKKHLFRRPGTIAMLILSLLGSLIILEFFARFFYYQRHGKYSLALINAISYFIASDKKPDVEINEGRWRLVENAKSRNKMTDEQKRQIQQLRSIGYLSGSLKAPWQKNVTIYNEKQAYNAYNLVVSGHKPEAILMDMTGCVIHKWGCDVFRAWPDFNPNEFMGKTNSANHSFWRRAHIMENGDLLAIFEGIGVIKLDKNSNIIWKLFNGAHHDLYVGKNGNIYVLTREAHINKKYNPDVPILEDFISILEPNGTELEKISILDLLLNSDFAPILRRGKLSGDIFHTNTIELIEELPHGLNHPLTQGTVLISVVQLDYIFAVDLVKKTVYWGESDYWHYQHQPTLLPNGNILILDNMGFEGRSSILEFDPGSRKIEWTYRGTKENPFYTGSCGACQRLQNGNTLITETDPGRAFEVTRGGKIVWEYINPYRAGKKSELIASLLEVVRLSPDFPVDWLPRNPVWQENQ